MEENIGAKQSALRSARARLSEKAAQLKRVNDELDAAENDYKETTFAYLDRRLKALRETRTRRRLVLALGLIVVGLVLLFLPLPIYVPILYLAVAVIVYTIVLKNSAISGTIISAEGAIGLLRAEEPDGGGAE